MARLVNINTVNVTIEFPIEAAEKIIEDVDELTTHRKDPRFYEELEKLASMKVIINFLNERN